MNSPENSPQTSSDRRNCPICGASETTDSSFSTPPWEVGTCVACGMTYLKNPPRQETLKDDFAWEKTKVQERTARRTDRSVYYFFSDGAKKIRWILRRGKRREVELLKRLHPQGGRLLDIGCATGASMRPLQGTNWQLFGIEPSPGLAEIANDLCSTTGGRVLQETALSGLPLFDEDYFDALMMRSFLEHDSHTAETLMEAHRTLKPGGFAIIKVPNATCWNARLRGAGWPGVRHPDHVNYFAPKDLLRLLKQCGFHNVKFPFSWRLPTSDNMWAVAYKDE